MKQAKSKDAAERVWQMFQFQYAPIVKELKANLTPENWKKFDSASASMKIHICDQIAEMSGL